ncbi:Arrestin-like, N-terminal and Immunoglobulin E-set domain protein [Pseudohyphozyma bogoriensis]|nr:Arrestin-like, N-terminal and Immunoglobulin E-set domain protein [Pseudohyphozyma bogoriensis]
MIASFLSKPTVKVTIEQEQISVCPPLPGLPDEPSNDPILRGTVVLSLPSARAVKRINVLMEGLCDAYGGDGYPYESTTTLSKNLKLDIGGEMLDAGTYAYNFSFIIPSSTSVYQRCTYGRVRHYVKAKVEFASGFSSYLSSDPVGFWISPTASSSHNIPEPLEINIEHFSEDLGPIGVGISSPHLTVASLINLRLAIISPAKRCTITSVKGFIQQSFTILYNDPSLVATPPPRKFKLHHIEEGDGTAPMSYSSDRLREADPVPLVELQPGQEYYFSRLTRCPNDDHVRPSTPEGTEARIRVASKIVVEIKYSAEGGEEKVITIAKPVFISSCCSTMDSYYLPAYSKAPPKTIQRPIDNRCICNLSWKEMVDRDGFTLQPAGEIETPTDSRLLGSDRLEKSPARPYSRPASETANEAARADPQAATDPNIGRAASDSTTEKRKIPNDAEKNGGAGKEKSGIDHLDKPSGSEEDVHADRLPKQQDPLNEDQKAKKGKM